jgi:hypothetical protein
LVYVLAEDGSISCPQMAHGGNGIPKHLCALQPAPQDVPRQLPAPEGEARIY